MSYIIDTNKYQVWFQDTDPDTGEISQTKLICIAINKAMADWVVKSLIRTNNEIGDPNRDFIIVIDYSLPP